MDLNSGKHKSTTYNVSTGTTIYILHSLILKMTTESHFLLIQDVAEIEGIIPISENLR
jgi:hypothetical protein